MNYYKIIEHRDKLITNIKYKKLVDSYETQVQKLDPLDILLERPASNILTSKAYYLYKLIKFNYSALEDIKEKLVNILYHINTYYNTCFNINTIVSAVIFCKTVDTKPQLASYCIKELFKYSREYYKLLSKYNKYYTQVKDIL